MPIYEYFCPQHNKIYQFYAKTLAQGRTVPRCPDDPKHRMVKMLSAFSVMGGRKDREAGGSPSSSRLSRDYDAASAPGALGNGDDARMEAAMGAMEGEFANVDENDPRAMGRMMRRMAELTGEKIDGEAEEVVRKLEEGADPESLGEQWGADESAADGSTPAVDPAGAPPRDASGPRAPVRARRGSPLRDPKLYDYDS
jgi:hypothetical protein